MPDVFKLPSFHLKPGCLRSRASVSLERFIPRQDVVH